MHSEDEQLSIVRALAITDPSPDPELDELIRYVARVCNVPSALLGLFGRKRLWLKSRLGVDVSEIHKFALPADVTVIEDTDRDPRASLNPLLAVAPDARFLAMAPLREGAVELGVLAVMDRKPRTLAPHHADALRSTASVAAGIVKLRRRVRLLEALVDSSPDLFYAFDTNGRCIYASEGGARSVGLGTAAMVGRAPHELGWEPEHAAQFQAMLRLALATGQPIEDARQVSTPGGFAQYEYILTPLRGQRGEIEGVAVTGRDVTARMASEAERRAALEKAQRAVRQRDDVLAVVSHDLRNTLNVVRLSTASLADELPEDAAAARELVNRLQGHASSMSRLVDDLVDVGRIDAGGLRIVRSRCDARALAEDAVLNVEPLAKRKGISLEAHLPAPGTLVHCDRGRILQVFGNVLGNAVKFTEDGVIRLDVAVGDSEVRFSIADTGAGISPEHLPHLFERYWQARAGERSGAGLGLYIARGIVEAHGGRISAESTPGKGTTVSFTLPRVDPLP